MVSCRVHFITTQRVSNSHWLIKPSGLLYCDRTPKAVMVTTNINHLVKAISVPHILKTHFFLRFNESVFTVVHCWQQYLKVFSYQMQFVCSLSRRILIGSLSYHHMMTSSNGNIFRVTGRLCGKFTGEFPAQRPVTRSFDVFFELRLNQRLSKQPWGWWFETPAWSLWRHRNEQEC